VIFRPAHAILLPEEKSKILLNKHQEEPVDKRMGMLVDLRKCYGCNSCTVACKQEHELPVGTTRVRVETVGPMGTYPVLKMHFEPKVCVQCENPPCVEACTKHAIRRRPDGVVVIDHEKCIGDALCVQKCPYRSIELDAQAKVAEKCDLCARRLDQGVQPSCVVACPGRALLVGDFADPQSQVSRAVALAGEENVLVPNPELGTGPTLRYLKPDASTPPLAFTTLFDPDRDLSGILPSLVTPVDESAGERLVKSICRGCHGVCGVRIIIRNGRVIKVEGDPECPTNFGTLCPKGLASIQHLYHPDRLLYPLKRAGERGEGKWERITWEEAMDALVSKLAEVRDTYGPEYVALARGTGRVWNDFGRRFTNVYGTATGMTKSPNCYFPRIEVSKAHVGHRIPVCDYYGFGGEYPRCVLVWGNNIVGSHSDGMAGARFIDSINRGARLIVIDPAFTNLAAKADLWLSVRPVTDAALAMGLLNVVVGEGLFDREFVTRWSNAPFLVRRDTGALLTQRDLKAEGSEAGWLVLDRSGGEVVPANAAGLVPALDGVVTVSLADGRKVECRTAWTVLKERLEDYTPEAVEEITWVPAQRIREAARLFATTRPAVIQWGVSFDHQGINSTRAGHAALILMAITGNIDVPGGMALWVNGGWIDGPSPEHVLLDLIPQRALDFVADYGRREFPLFCRGTSYMSHGSLVEAGVLEGKLPLQAAIIVGNNPAGGIGERSSGHRRLQENTLPGVLRAVYDPHRRDMRSGAAGLNVAGAGSDRRRALRLGGAVPPEGGGAPGGEPLGRGDLLGAGQANGPGEVLHLEGCARVLELAPASNRGHLGGIEEDRLHPRAHAVSKVRDRFLSTGRRISYSYRQDGGLFFNLS
jgi:Fe-S-cluster-containing dehydrogenase component